MFNSVKAQVALRRFISFRVDTRHIERTIRPAVATPDAFAFVDDDRAAILFGNRAFGTAEHTGGLFAVHTLKFYEVPMESSVHVGAFVHLD